MDRKRDILQRAQLQPRLEHAAADLEAVRDRFRGSRDILLEDERLGIVAGLAPVTLPEGHQFRRFDKAGLEAERAARMKGAASWQLFEVGRRAGDGVEPLGPDLDIGRRVEQAQRIGVARIVEQFVDRPRLDRPPRIHHQHLVGEAGNDAQVVRDDDERRAEFGADLVEVTLAQAEQFLALELHAARGIAVLGQEPDQRERRLRLARTAFADEGH
eukprot:gene4108-5610_t